MEVGGGMVLTHLSSSSPVSDHGFWPSFAGSCLVGSHCCWWVFVFVGRHSFALLAIHFR